MKKGNTIFCGQVTENPEITKVLAPPLRLVERSLWRSEGREDGWAKKSIDSQAD